MYPRPGVQDHLQLNDEVCLFLKRDEGSEERKKGQGRRGGKERGRKGGRKERRKERRTEEGGREGKEKIDSGTRSECPK